MYTHLYICTSVKNTTNVCYKLLYILYNSTKQLHVSASIGHLQVVWNLNIRLIIRGGGGGGEISP
jgi:hypothetical protein